MSGIPRIGSKVTFIPAAFTAGTGSKGLGGVEVPRKVTGKVTFVNRPHRFYVVEYKIDEGIMRECFKF